MSPSIPAHLRRYFWEYGADPPSPSTDRYTVVKRLLDSGGWDAVEWLRANVGDDALRSFLLAHGGRGLGPKRLRFWGLILDLPRPTVDSWIRAQQSNPWHGRTRR